MEHTLEISDHVFVNRIQFAPKSSWVGPLLPYRDVHFRDIVVFLSPAEPGLARGKTGYWGAGGPPSTCGTGVDSTPQWSRAGRALRVA